MHSNKTAVDLPEPRPHADRLGRLRRRAPIGLPGLSEPEVVRHYTRLSQKNYCIDSGFYPLGSCTMKHNPRLNEKVARLPGLGDLHPLQPVSTVQGALAVIHTCAHWLKTLSGMPAVAMSPGAGAHGELVGLMTIRAAIEDRGERRVRILVPESAHGTNPASAHACGYVVEAIPADDRGRVDLAALRGKLGRDVAAIMVTNPNTCGLFETDIVEIAEAAHAVGAFFYCDGANFNAIVGRVRPADLGIDCMHINLHKTFSTPHGGGGPGSGPVVMSQALARYAPLPYVVHDGERYHLVEHAGENGEDAGEAKPIGRIKGFHGQFGMFTRALAYMMAMGADGLRQASGDAVLNANYIMARLRDTLHPAFAGPCMHEVAVRRLRAQGYRGQHAGLRQGLDRRGLSPDDGVFPAGCARRHAGRADRDREQGDTRSVHRHRALAGGPGQGRRRRSVPSGAASDAAPAARRDRRGASARVALAAGHGQKGRGVARAGPRRNDLAVTDASLRSLSYAVDIRVVARYFGYLSLSLAAMAAVPAGVALGFGETMAAEHYAIVCAALLAGGVVLSRVPADDGIQINEGLVTVALTFIVGALAMSWPFMAAGLSFVDAFFEAVSGLTTTGLSTLASVEDKPVSFLFTRAWLQWYGGLAIIVVALAVIIGPSANAKRLSVDEGGGAEVVASARVRARGVLKVYVGLTIAGVVLLWIAGASPFDAIVHTFAAVSTGGFSSHDGGVAPLPTLAAAGISLLSLFGAISFSLHFRALRSGPRTLWEDGEVRALITLVVLTSLALSGCMLAAGGAPGPALAGDAAFLAISAQTTTGFATVPVGDLSAAAKLILIVSMAIGGDMGSTAGGIKIFRLLVVGRLLQLLLARTCVASHAVMTPRIAGRIIDDVELRIACGVVAAYACVVAVSWFVFVAFAYDPLDALFEVVSAVATAGLSAGLASPGLPAALKGLLCVDMLMGRLEIIAILVLVYPRTWFARKAHRS